MRRTNIFRGLFFLSTSLLFVTSLVVALLLGLNVRRFAEIHYEYHDWILFSVLDHFISTHSQITSLISPPPGEDSALPAVYLTINPSSIDALNENLPESGRARYHPALVNFKGVDYEAKARYRGRQSRHFAGPRKSWRMRLQREHDRITWDVNTSRDLSNFTDWLSYRFARKAGLMAPDAEFVRFFLNGEFMGPSLLFERVDASYFTRRGLAVSDLYAEADKVTHDMFHWAPGTPPPDWENRLNEEKGLGVEWLSFLELLGNPGAILERDIGKYLDVETYLKFVVHQTLFGSLAHSGNHNFRFYYNTENLRFIPLVFDTDGLGIRQTGWFSPARYIADPLLLGTSFNSLTQKMLKISEFRHRRNLMLWQALNETYTEEDMLDELDLVFRTVYPDNLRDRKAAYIRDEYTFYHRQSLPDYQDRLALFITDNSRHLKQLLEKCQIGLKPIVELPVESLFSESVPLTPSKLELRLTGHVGATVSALSAVPPPRDLGRTGDGQPAHRPDLVQSGPEPGSWTLIQDWRPMNERREDRRLAPVETHFQLDWSPTSTDESGQEELSFANAITGKTVTPEPGAAQIVWTAHELLSAKRLEPAALAARDFHVAAGDYAVDTLIVLSSGQRLVVDAGIIARGPILLNGEADDPIILQGQGGNSWRGITVEQGPDERSTLSYVVVVGAYESYHEGRWLSGAMNLYGGHFDLRGCAFISCSGEDGLNAKHARVSLSESYFIDSAGDVLDLDFSTAEIRDCYFLNPGNDGIDLGSSRATVYGCEIRGAGDKGVSVGEGSLIDLQLPFIAHSQVGIAAKDESTVRITDATLIGNATAIAAYVKKPTFAPPSVEVYGLRLHGNRRDFLILNNTHLLQSDRAFAGREPANRYIRFLHSQGSAHDAPPILPLQL